MTWITFLMYLLLGYIAYYAFNFLFDLLKKPTLQAGEVETLSVTNNIETIEVYNDDDQSNIVITANNSTEDENNQSYHNENTSKKEVTESIDKPESQIIASTVEAVISHNGGVPLKSLAEIYRQKAIRESNKLPFAS